MYVIDFLSANTLFLQAIILERIPNFLLYYETEWYCVVKIFVFPTQYPNTERTLQVKLGRV